MPHGTLGGSIHKREGGRDTNKETSEGLVRPHSLAPMPLDCFVFQIPALAQAGFRVLALDMKGYGDSSSPPGELTVL